MKKFSNTAKAVVILESEEAVSLISQILTGKIAVGQSHPDTKEEVLARIRTLGTQEKPQVVEAKPEKKAAPKKKVVEIPSENPEGHEPSKARPKGPKVDKRKSPEFIEHLRNLAKKRKEEAEKKKAAQEKKSKPAKPAKKEKTVSKKA